MLNISIEKIIKCMQEQLKCIKKINNVKNALFNDIK